MPYFAVTLRPIVCIEELTQVVKADNEKLAAGIADEMEKYKDHQLCVNFEGWQVQEIRPATEEEIEEAEETGDEEEE